MPRPWRLRDRPYLRHPSESGPVKIGIAAAPEARLKALQTASPSPLSLEYFFKCSDPLDVPMEAAVHRLLQGTSAVRGMV
jgi:Meiotically up-regulated gene 113